MSCGIGCRMVPTLPLVVVLCFFCSALGGRIRLVEAGKDGARFTNLDRNTSFCPESFKKGFSFECFRFTGATDVTFFVNRTAERREGAPPYMIAGDNDGTIFPWKQYQMGTTRIDCLSSTGESAMVYVTFDCSRNTPEMKVASTSPSEGNLPEVRPQSNKCIMIDSTDHIGRLRAGWGTNGGSIHFMMDDDSIETYPPTAAPVTYSFVPHTTATYAITLDMETYGSKHHNGLYVSMEVGFSLRRRGKHGEMLFLRGQNQTEYVSSDTPGRTYYVYTHRRGERYSISTAQALRKGVPHHITIAPRYTKVRVMNIILFPCSEDDCESYSQYWEESLSKCYGDYPNLIARA